MTTGPHTIIATPGNALALPRVIADSRHQLVAIGPEVLRTGDEGICFYGFNAQGKQERFWCLQHKKMCKYGNVECSCSDCVLEHKKEVAGPCLIPSPLEQPTGFRFRDLDWDMAQAQADQQEIRENTMRLGQHAPTDRKAETESNCVCPICVLERNKDISSEDAALLRTHRKQHDQLPLRLALKFGAANFCPLEILPPIIYTVADHEVEVSSAVAEINWTTWTGLSRGDFASEESTAVTDQLPELAAKALLKHLGWEKYAQPNYPDCVKTVPSGWSGSYPLRTFPYETNYRGNYRSLNRGPVVDRFRHRPAKRIEIHRAMTRIAEQVPVELRFDKGQRTGIPSANTSRQVALGSYHGKMLQSARRQDRERRLPDLPDQRHTIDAEIENGISGRGVAVIQDEIHGCSTAKSMQDNDYKKYGSKGIQELREQYERDEYARLTKELTGRTYAPYVPKIVNPIAPTWEGYNTTKPKVKAAKRPTKEQLEWATKVAGSAELSTSLTTKRPVGETEKEDDRYADDRKSDRFSNDEEIEKPEEHAWITNDGTTGKTKKLYLYDHPYLDRYRGMNLDAVQTDRIFRGRTNEEALRLNGEEVTPRAIKTLQKRVERTLAEAELMGQIPRLPRKRSMELRTQLIGELLAGNSFVVVKRNNGWKCYPLDNDAGTIEKAIRVLKGTLIKKLWQKVPETDTRTNADLRMKIDEEFKTMQIIRLKWHSKLSEDCDE